MDPKANITEQREIANGLIEVLDGGITTVNTNEVARLAELVIALDEWRSNGGYDPYPDAALPTTREGVRQQVRRTL